jgi:iron complex outermembrane recepter protein
MKRIAITTTCFLTALSLWAQDQQVKDSFVLLEPVEVKATRAGENSPFTRTDLSKKEIEKVNLGQDLPFLLNQTPAVVINSDAGNGVGYTGIRIRGTDATRINVTLNGIPYNDAESQGTFFVDLPDFSSSVNSIQIQRGVGTSTNGAGAFGGTINISTNEINKVPYAEFNNSYGSFNTWKNTVKAGSGLLNDHFTMDLRLSNIVSDGYIDRATSNLKSLYFSTAYFNKKSSLRFNAFLGKEKTYQAWNGVSESDLENNRTINYAGTEKPGEPYDNETDNYNQDHYQLFFNHRFNDLLSFSTAIFLSNGKGYYEQYKAGEDYADYQLPYPVYGTATILTTDLVRQLWLDNHYYGNIFSFLYKKNKSQLTLGGGFTKYDGNHFGKVIWAANGLSDVHPEWYRHDALKKDFNIYSKWQQQLLPNFYSFIDLQYRNVHYNINGFRDNPNLQIGKEYQFFNPKVGFRFSKNGWSTYLSYSRGSKEPNRDDFEAGKHQQPKPEYLNDIEFSIGKGNEKINWEATAYYMQYKDQLVLTGQINDVGAYTRTNIPNSYRTGIELAASASPAKWLNISANLALSKNKVKDFTEYIDDYDAGGQKNFRYSTSDIAFSPAIVGAASLHFLPVKNLDISLLNKYVGKQYLDNTQNENRKLDAYFVQDIISSYTINKGWLKEATVILQANNIFNKKYEPNGYTFSYIYGGELTTENYYFPMAGTNFMVGLNIKL